MTDSPIAIAAHDEPCVLSRMDDDARRTRPTQPHMTDAEREEAIARAGRAVLRHMGKWQSDGCFAALGDAHRARRLMEQLIAGRSAQQVARMERERGLDVPACANEGHGIA